MTQPRRLERDQPGSNPASWSLAYLAKLPWPLTLVSATAWSASKKVDCSRLVLRTGPRTYFCPPDFSVRLCGDRSIVSFDSVRAGAPSLSRGVPSCFHGLWRSRQMIPTATGTWTTETANDGMSVVFRSPDNWNGRSGVVIAGALKRSARQHSLLIVADWPETIATPCRYDAQ